MRTKEAATKICGSMNGLTDSGMRLLFIANEGKPGVHSFFLSSVLAAKECGVEVHLAYNCIGRTAESIKRDESMLGVIFHQIDFIRNPFHLGNIKAYRQLLSLMRKEQFDIVHTSTPIGGVIGRLCAKRVRCENIIYTAHGFHFYKGAPLENWLLYYPMEKLCSIWTDVLITINKEDYNLAQKKMKTKQVEYIPGIGVDLSKFKFQPNIRERIRKNLGLKPDEIMLFSVGELNENKNHEILIKTIAKANNQKFQYFIAGVGHRMNYLEQLILQLDVIEQVHLLGFRMDVQKLLCGADIFCLPSYREGLSVALMEAMASGLPCVVSNIRGNVDLIENGVGGYLCTPQDVDAFAAAISKLATEPDLRKKMGKNNLNAIKKFDTKAIKQELIQIYHKLLKKDLESKNESPTFFGK